MGVIETMTTNSKDLATEVGVPDMTKISNINIDIINKNLVTRYNFDIIYTYIDNILLAINPYKQLDIYGFVRNNYYIPYNLVYNELTIYGFLDQLILFASWTRSHYTRDFRDYIHQYTPSKIPLLPHMTSSKANLPPHIFSITEKCYRQLTNPILQSIPQSILISGESGSGKTETSKFVLQYLCEISSNENYWLQEQILEGNVILEAFGNATTVRNNNSSRFGKFLQIYFNQNAITGAVVTNYLLEKSRIVGQSAHERNYHIFYQLLHGSSFEKYGLQPIHYKYCNQYSPGVTITADHDNWNHLLVSLNVLEFSSESINTIFNLLGVILWFGNLDFVALDEDLETSSLSSDSIQVLEIIAKLLQLPSDTLSSLLLQRQITIRGIVTDIPFRPTEASDNRHSMSQYLYMKIFNYLVYFINGRINRDVHSTTTFVGLLDIFGFENFTKNSFEQLCINYSNEKLQGYFNEYIFRVEQEMYESEGLDYSYISYLDNSSCLEFLERTPRSLLKLLSEQCHLPKGSDASFLQNLSTEHASHVSFSLPSDRRLWNEQFNVIHYAGVVTYTVDGFVNKNRHLVQDGFHNYLLDNEPIKVIISCNEKATTSTLKYKSTLIEDFRQELSSLMGVLQSSEPWYIRCLKPNLTKESNNYDSCYIMEQLKYLGIVDLVKIKQSGYPINYSHQEFVHKYKILISSNSKENFTIDKIITKLNDSKNQFLMPEFYQIGTSKVFLKSTLHNHLESARNFLILQATIKIQTMWRSYRVKSNFQIKVKSAITIQRYYRSLKQRLHFLKLKKSALILQSHLRGKFGREVVKTMREMKRIEKELRVREEERRNSTTIGTNYNSVDELLDLLLNEENGSPDVKRNKIKSSISFHSSIASLTDDDYDINEDDESVNENESMTSDFDRSNNSINTIQSPIQSTAPSEESEMSSEPPPPNEIVIPEIKNHIEYKGLKIISKQPPTLPEPTLPPPPPPPATFYAPPQPIINQAGVTKNIKHGGNEPIYESIQLANGIIPLKEQPKEVIGPRIPDLPPPLAVVDDDPPPLPPPPPIIENGNVEKIESEIESDDSAQLPRPQHQNLNLVNYANDFFNDLYESNLMDTLKKRPKLISKGEMIKYSKCNTISNSHIYLYDPDNVQLALNIWKDLQKYLTTSRSGTTFIQNLVTHGLEQEELRDEIYIQIIRQLNGNPHNNQSLKLVILLQFIMRIFQCSSELKKYLGHFLNQIASGTTDLRIHNHIINLLKSTTEFWGNRKIIPSLIEINYYFQNTQQLIHHIKLYLLNNSYLLLNIHPVDTYGSLLGKLSLLLKTEFIDDGTWGIYESNSELTEMYYLPKYDHIYDLVASWERTNEIILQTNVPNLLLVNPGKKLVLKKRLFKTTLPPPTHPLEINLNYLQCIYEVIRLDKYVVTEKVGVALAGIQIQLLHGNYKADILYRIEDLLPQRLLEVKKLDQWMPLLEDSHYQITQLKENKFALQLRYLNCARKLSFYGTSLFDLSYYGYRDYDPHLLLGINATQLLLIQQDLTVLNSFAYEEIQTLQIQDESLVINLSSTKFVFKTKFTDDIFTLITSYYPKLKKTETKFTHPLITNSYRSKLLRALVDARNLLITNNYLNLETSVLKSKSRKQYSMYFNYSKTPITHSLLKLNQSEEVTAIEIFKFILSYTQGDGQLKPFLSKLGNNNLLNEAYLQLIKQSNSTLPNSNVTRKTWSLFNLLANYLLPTNKLIMNYLVSHLKYYSMNSFTVVGDYAKIVMKSLQNSNAHNKLMKTIRKFIPSSTEINFVIHFKPISIKVFLLNNNYYTVELGNHYDTIQDILGILFNYIGLDGQDCRGYGIYETSTLNGNYCENYLIPATPLVDVLSRWENSTTPTRGNGQQMALKYKLVFKKYLNKFLNLSNPIEKELLLQQLLFNIKMNKYPINTNEGEILIALLSQIHLGNYEQMDPGEFPDYCSILSKYFPTNLSVNISYERVSYYHQSLVGSKAEESYKSIFNLLTCWPLYKGSLFCVVQSFTPSWPRNLWLILEETGIFLLEERTKNVIANYNFTDLLNYIPTTNYLMLVVRNEAKGVKVILNTVESYNITYLIREYVQSPG